MNVVDNEYLADGLDWLADVRTIWGTHRRKESNLKWWPTLVAVVIPALTMGWVISNYIGSSEEEPVPIASAREILSGALSGASSTASPSGDPSSSDGNKPSESGKSSKNPPTDASTIPSRQESSMSADTSAGCPALVLNGPKKPGLTVTGKQKLEKAGYTKVSANNYNGGSPAVSIAFYAKTSDAQAARQVVAALGIRPGNVVLTPKATGSNQIVAALCTDAR